MLPGQPVFQASGADPLGLWMPPPGGPVSFAVEPAETDEADSISLFRVDLPEAPAAADEALARGEAGLERAMAALETVPARLEGLAQPVETGVSFGGVGEEFEPLEQAKARFDDFSKTLLRDALVETRLGGRMVARTRLGWNGSASTVWVEGASPREVDAHLRCLRLAAGSRLANLRVVLMALRLAALAANPAQAFGAALRMVWGALRA